MLDNLVLQKENPEINSQFYDISCVFFKQVCQPHVIITSVTCDALNRQNKFQQNPNFSREIIRLYMYRNTDFVFVEQCCVPGTCPFSDWEWFSL